MNIDTFGIHQSGNHHGEGDNAPFAHNDVAAIKQKIENRKVKQKRLKHVFSVLIVVIVLLAGAFAYSQYKLYTLSKEELVGDTKSSSLTQDLTTPPKDASDVVKRLGRHILLPSGTPQIAEVQDAAKLKETQAFFKDAQNGDIVVVYETMIYIYRPSADIVVGAADISGVGQKNP